MATTEQTVPTAALAVPGTRKVVGGILAVGVPLALWFLPLPLEANAKHALAVASFMIMAWITEVMPHALTGMVGCYLFWALKTQTRSEMRPPPAYQHQPHAEACGRR